MKEDSIYDGPISEAVNHFGRAVPEPYKKTVERTEIGIDFRHIAMLLMLNKNNSNTARLFVAVMVLMELTEQRRTEQGQTAQAEAARKARAQLQTARPKAMAGQHTQARPSAKRKPKRKQRQAAQPAVKNQQQTKK